MCKSIILSMSISHFRMDDSSIRRNLSSQPTSVNNPASHMEERLHCRSRKIGKVV